MNILYWIGLCFLVFNFIFISIIAIIYVREQWLIVDRETKEEMERQKAQDEKMKEMDYLLTQIFINENDNKTTEKTDQE